MKEQGFVTIAVGDIKYYQMAAHLLRSYRMNSASGKTPFALLCDRENKYTAQFDDVVILEAPHRSYLDKIDLLKYVPYQYNIFVDADCLCYDDIDILWQAYPSPENSPMSVFGKITDEHCWFDRHNIGRFGERVDYSLDMHGGVYFITRCPELDEMHADAMEVLGEYDRLSFRMFDKPDDEPILALVMAMHKCKPLSYSQAIAPYRPYAFLPIIQIQKANIRKKRLTYKANGHTINNKVLLLHFTNVKTGDVLYRTECARVELGPILSPLAIAWIKAGDWVKRVL